MTNRQVIWVICLLTKDLAKIYDIHLAIACWKLSSEWSPTCISHPTMGRCLMSSNNLMFKVLYVAGNWSATNWHFVGNQSLNVHCQSFIFNQLVGDQNSYADCYHIQNTFTNDNLETIHITLKAKNIDSLMTKPTA